jgi:hypothetical protein
MRRLITTTIFIILVSAITAQTNEKTIHVGNVISDTTTFKSINYRSTLTSILKSKYKIEIRFISIPSFDYSSYTVLTYDKKWSAKYYYHTPEINTTLSKEIKSKTPIDTLFSRLVLNNIFSLPDQDSLKTEKYDYNPETNEFFGSGMAVGDGICYHIEFKIGDYYRRYSYCNPNDYADFYPQIYELRSFANIVELFTEWTKE